MFEMVVRLLLGLTSRKNEQEKKAHEVSYWARKATSSKYNSLQTHYRDITGKELS
jgi:hypothetical protein